MKQSYWISAVLVLSSFGTDASFGAQRARSGASESPAKYGGASTMDVETSQKTDLAFTRSTRLRVGDDAPDFQLTPFGATRDPSA